MAVKTETEQRPETEALRTAVERPPLKEPAALRQTVRALKVLRLKADRHQQRATVHRAAAVKAEA